MAVNTILKLELSTDQVHNMKHNSRKSNYPTNRVPKNNNVDRAIISSCILCSYVNRIFSHYLESIIDYEAFRPMERISGNITDKEKIEKYKDHYNKHQDVFTEVDLHFNGIRSSSRLKFITGEYNPSKLQGFYRYCAKFLRIFFDYSSNADRTIEKAVVNSIVYSIDRNLYSNSYAYDLLSEFGLALKSNLESHDVLNGYTSITKVAQEIIDGNDPVVMNVINDNSRRECGIIDYIEACPIPSNCPNYMSLELYDVLCRMFQMARILSTIVIDTEHDQFTLEYNEGNPPQANYSLVSNKDALSFRRFDNQASDAERETVHDTHPSGISGTDNSNGTGTKGFINYSKLISAPEIMKGDDYGKSESEISDFVNHQHNRLKVKRILCAEYDNLAEKYVDIKMCDGGVSLLDYTFDCLSNGSSLLIHGSGGMGKSTISYLTYERMYQDFINDSHRPVPIIVPPRVFFSKGITDRNLMRFVIRDCDTGLNENVSFKDRSIVLFIDAIDEYFKPESDELEEMLLCTRGTPKLITGRTEVSRAISYAFEGSVVNLGDSVNRELFDAIIKRYSSYNKQSKDIDEFIHQLHGLESTPLVAALIATYLSSNEICYVNGKPIIGSFYSEVVKNMIVDKIRTINKTIHPILSADQANSILCEYAWTRYLYPSMNLADRIDRVSEKTGLDHDTVRKMIVEFTEADGVDDRMFLHMSIQDFLVARWVLKQSSQKAIEDEFFHVMFRTEVQRFIGDYMKLNPPIAIQVTSFCIRIYRECESISDVALRNNYQTKVIYLMSRASFVGNAQASFDVEKQLRRIVSKNETSPQLAMALLCVTMLGDMHVEAEYANRIRSDLRFAEIARILYLVYEGDLDAMNLDMEDTRGHFNNVVQGYIEDVGEYNLRDDRCKYLCRTQTILMETLIESGYILSNDQARQLSTLDEEQICDWVMSEDFNRNLQRFGIESDEYRIWLANEIRNLKALSMRICE